MNLLKDIKELLGSWKTTAVLFIIYAAALAAATFIEARMNIAAARSIIYLAWWMYVLYGVMILNFIFVMLRMRLIQRKMWGVLGLHTGLIITITGALITNVWSFEGMMHIREGESANTIVMEDQTFREVPMSVKLNDFNIVRHYGSSSPSSFESDVTITHAGDSFDRKIFMNNIARVAGYRLYQSSYDRDEMGTILSVNYDPIGTAVTYAGYILLFLGMTVALFEPGSRLRKLYASLGKND